MLIMTLNGTLIVGCTPVLTSTYNANLTLTTLLFIAINPPHLSILLLNIKKQD